LRKGCVYVVSDSFSTLGVGISVGPMFKVQVLDPCEVGNAVNAALAEVKNWHSASYRFARRAAGPISIH